VTRGTFDAVLTLVLLASLNATPHVALLDDGPRFSARLIQSEQAPQDYSTWSRDDLRREYNRLDLERPSVAFPITLMVVGGIAFVSGLYAGLLALIGSISGGASTTLLVVTGVLCLAGLGLLLSGVVLLVGTLKDRRQMGTEMDRIKEQLNGGPQQMPPSGPPMGPLPPGPSQVFAPPAPGIQLARF